MSDNLNKAIAKLREIADTDYGWRDAVVGTIATLSLCAPYRGEANCQCWNDTELNAMIDALTAKQDSPGTNPGTSGTNPLKEQHNG